MSSSCSVEAAQLSRYCPHSRMLTLYLSGPAHHRARAGFLLCRDLIMSWDGPLSPARHHWRAVGGSCRQDGPPSPTVPHLVLRTLPTRTCLGVSEAGCRCLAGAVAPRRSGVDHGEHPPDFTLWHHHLVHDAGTTRSSMIPPGTSPTFSRTTCGLPLPSIWPQSRVRMRMSWSVAWVIARSATSSGTPARQNASLPRTSRSSNR